jgi:phosphopantetheinyl transferase
VITSLPEGFHMAFRSYGSSMDHKVDLGRLTEVERAYVALFRNEPRRRASAAARAACRKILHQIGHTGWQVIPDEHGAPHLVTIPEGEPVSTASVSLTHRNGVAAALLSETRDTLAVGLDLERPQPSILRTLDDFYTSEEAQQVRALKPKDGVLMATRIWAAREAVLKTLGLGFGATPQSVSIRVIDDQKGAAVVRGIEGLPERLSVELRFGYVEDLMACVAWIERQDLAELRACRPKPRRSFPWTNFKARMFDNNKTQKIGGMA